MGGAVVSWFEWRNAAYTSVPIAVLVASVVFTFKLFSSSTKPYRGAQLPLPDCRQSSEKAMATSSNDEEAPNGVTQLNDSLYQLFAPRGEPEIDIILFHGLQASDYKNAYWKSWMSEDGKMLWPQALLGKKFPNARILSVSYDSAAAKTLSGGNGDLYTIAENFVDDIILSQSERGDRPVLLVGHSLGGLLLKNFIMMAPRFRDRYNPEDFLGARKIDTINTFLANVRGIFYYSTPHTGSELANIASKIPESSEVLIFLKTLSKESARLNQDFAAWRKIKRILAYSLGESLTTDPAIWGVKGMKPTKIVVEASCRFDTDEFYTVPANHITICQPNNDIQASFLKLGEFVKACLEASLYERFNRLRPDSQQFQNIRATRRQL